MKRSGSIIRDAKGNARQTRITRGPSSIRKHRRAPVGDQSWTKDAKHMFGVADCVMIEDYENQKTFLDNLRVRYENDLIYTYIRGVCISVNPYQDLDVYTGSLIDEYFGSDIFELPPHLYAVANQAYYDMKEETADQCILISGESGAGKTEAAKQILQFLASTATNTGASTLVRDRLLQANPILEAFGNAKTLRNDNSSRFGKYMEVQFDFKGEPIGGKIINYLLEKSRVVRQLVGERNYHIFYMLLTGSPEEWKSERGLEKGAEGYFYTNQGNICTVPELNDKEEWDNMFAAMSDVGIDSAERTALLDVAAFVLRLGEVEFAEGDAAQVKNTAVVDSLAQLIGVDAGVLTDALTHNTRVTRSETIKSPLTGAKAMYARDALAKTLYDRAFSWLVGRLNAALKTVQGADAGRTTVMGLLDIYGFEILSSNGFEQICINYCNEKLQQLFIELTLKSEQEEYRKEGIEWVPVEYFDNDIICQLIESPKNPAGMITVLDDCCLGPGDLKDGDFLGQMDKMFGSHQHYASFASDKTIKRDSFLIKHYAGDVSYTSNGFIDANNDLLYRDLKAAMLSSASTVIKGCFSEDELESKKRPATAGTQFRGSMHALMATLMAKEPSYVRCVKPNSEKKANLWNADEVVHQVKYLGLMENLRVARAGYCYRRPFAYFLERYKSLCPATWPSWKGDPKDGVKALADHLALPAGEIAIGNTKVFVRNPTSVTAIERRFQKNKHVLATKIQACFRCFRQRRVYLKLKQAAVSAQKYARAVIAKAAAEKRKKSVEVLRRLLKGFIERNKAESDTNRMFLSFTRISWLKKLVAHLPTSVSSTRWISDKETPESLKDTSQLLRKLCSANLQRKYRLGLDEKRKDELTKKLLASEMFRNSKSCYAASVGMPFTVNRIEEDKAVTVTAAVAAYQKLRRDDEVKEPLYTTLLHKFDRSTYKHKRDDIVILSNTVLRVFSSPKVKLKFELDLDKLVKISLSTLNDGVVVISTPGKLAEGDKSDKGDFIFDTPHAIELATMIIHTIAVKPGPPSPMDETFHGVRMPKVAEKLFLGATLEPTLKNNKLGKILFEVGEDKYEIVSHEGAKALKVSAPNVEGPSAFANKVRRSLKVRAPKQ